MLLISLEENTDIRILKNIILRNKVSLEKNHHYH